MGVNMGSVKTVGGKREINIEARGMNNSIEVHIGTKDKPLDFFHLTKDQTFDLLELLFAASNYLEWEFENLDFILSKGVTNA